VCVYVITSASDLIAAVIAKNHFVTRNDFSDEFLK